MEVRKVTCKLLELADEGTISYKTLAECALKYMSEDEVRDMAEANELLEYAAECEYEEEELDDLYHDYSEEELREMGCFDNLSEEED